MSKQLRLDPIIDTGSFSVTPSRRLVDKLLVAADAACDEDALPLAEMLVCLAEIAMQMSQPPSGVDRRSRSDAALIRVRRRIFCLQAAAKV